MTPLAAKLLREISANGPMRFDRYMERALFAPKHGYYSADRARIGREGDFHTSVSVGPVFGRVLAAQCEEVWERLGRPEHFDIVEQGANDGQLAADILDGLQADHPACFAATVVTLVEPFAGLRDRQGKMLARHAGHIEWRKSLDRDFTGVHVTNEYVDALPVRIFARSGEEWCERHVDAPNGRLEFVDLPSPDIPRHLPEGVPSGYLAEVRPQAARWIADVAAQLRAGLVLVIDYGFPRYQLHAPWRIEGTLSCYRANRRDDDPLEAPGEKDLTTHVDFTALAEAGRACGLEVAGFADQHHFLVGAGTPLMLALEKAPQSPERDALLRGLITLLHPETMGTQFKYLALTRDLDGPLSGFRHAKSAATALGLD